MKKINAGLLSWHPEKHAQGLLHFKGRRFDSYPGQAYFSTYPVCVYTQSNTTNIRVMKLVFSVGFPQPQDCFPEYLTLVNDSPRALVPPCSLRESAHHPPPLSQKEEEKKLTLPASLCSQIYASTYLCIRSQVRSW